MLEWVINGSVRTSTLLHLLARHWELIGAVIFLLLAMAFSLIKKGKNHKGD